jgi:hypothetical protein
VDKFGERGFRAALGVGAQELGVGFGLHLNYVITDPVEIRQKNLR